MVALGKSAMVVIVERISGIAGSMVPSIVGGGRSGSLAFLFCSSLTSGFASALASVLASGLAFAFASSFASSLSF